MFKDRATLHFIAGKGGNGVVAWRREKYIPKGGPCGGDGGYGGDIILETDPHLLSLEHLRHNRAIRAKNGGDGSSNNKHGKNGQPTIIKLPKGTLVKDPITEEILCDLSEPKQQFLLCKGGKGGKGNTHFATSVNRAPKEATPGKEGEEKNILLELKIIADIGLIGMPNAGKSTLLSTLAHAKVKTAPYPFTTLSPNIGVIEFSDYSKALIADIPGLIDNAHLNKGLGISFLKHVERTSLLLFVIDISALEGRDPIEDYLLLRREIAAYKQEVLDKPFLIILNKMDIEGAEEQMRRFIDHFFEDREKILAISALRDQTFLSLEEKIQQFILKRFV